MPRVQNPTLGGGQIAMLQTITQLSSADILALAATPKVLVPAPGAGQALAMFGVVFVFNFGTHRYSSAGDSIFTEYSGPDGDSTIANPIGNIIIGTAGTLAYLPGFTNALDDLTTGVVNQAIQLTAQSSYNVGPIVSTTLGAGGTGYAANDTGTITTGNGDATYKVLTVGGGGNVLTYQITAPGTLYATGAGQATATGGAQPGVGVGFTVNITAVQTGDGTLKVVTYYQIIPVP